MYTEEVEANGAQRSMRTVRHLVVDAAFTSLGLALSWFLLGASSPPETCPASPPTPVLCSTGERLILAFITIVSVLVVTGLSVIANHVLGGRVRVVSLVIALVAFLAVALPGLITLLSVY